MLVVKVAALEAYKRIAEARLQEYESINRSLQQEVIAAKASNAMVTNSSKEDVENMKEEVSFNLFCTQIRLRFSSPLEKEEVFVCEIIL